MDIQKGEDFEEAWQENRHIWESTKNLAKAMFYAGQAKAQAVPQLTNKMIVAIESEVESQLKASAIDADPFRLDGEKIWYAAIEAQEPK